MTKIKGSYLDKNGKKVDSENIFDDPRIMNAIKNGGEIVIPANRPDMYNFLKDIQKEFPNFKITTSASVRASFAANKIKENISHSIRLKEFKKSSSKEVDRLEYFFNNIFMDEKNMINGIQIFINKIENEFKENYDLIIDIIVKNIVTNLFYNSKLTIIHKPRKDNYFDGLPNNKEIAKVLCDEMLLLYNQNKFKNVNTLDYIHQQLPKDYSYKRTQTIISECFHYFLTLANRDMRGENN